MSRSSAAAAALAALRPKAQPASRPLRAHAHTCSGRGSHRLVRARRQLEPDQPRGPGSRLAIRPLARAVRAYRARGGRGGGGRRRGGRRRSRGGADRRGGRRAAQVRDQIGHGRGCRGGCSGCSVVAASRSRLRARRALRAAQRRAPLGGGRAAPVAKPLRVGAPLAGAAEPPAEQASPSRRILRARAELVAAAVARAAPVREPYSPAQVQRGGLRRALACLCSRRGRWARRAAAVASAGRPAPIVGRPSTS